MDDNVCESLLHGGVVIIVIIRSLLIITTNNHHSTLQQLLQSEMVGGWTGAGGGCRGRVPGGCRVQGGWYHVDCVVLFSYHFWFIHF